MTTQPIMVKLDHRDDCPIPLVLKTRLRRHQSLAIGRCVNCERVGIVPAEEPLPEMSGPDPLA